MVAVVSSAMAQKVAVSGFVKDSESADALIRATVQLMSADTTKMVSGTVTNNLGGYTIKNVPAPGTYIVKVSYIGYHNFFRKIELKEKQTTFSVGTTMLIPNSVMLQTAVVTGVLQQVEVKEDTVIFNADAFKTAEGSVLEELIKKIPGAEVDDNGGIKINGKKVTKILVKGKEFFNNDTQMAMKNLPTEIIDKIKVYDKQSDNARITGIDDGEEETVIDLGIKKGMNQGWFGNIDAGIGTKEQWNGRAMINRFTDYTQASLIGNIGSTGTRQNTQTGLNVAFDLNTLEIGGNIRYNTNKTDSWSRSSSENYVMKDMTTFSNRFNKNISHNNSLSGDFMIEWRIDSLTTLLFRPNFSFGSNDSWSRGQNATFNDDPYKIDSEIKPLEVLKNQEPVDVYMDLAAITTNYQDQASKGDGTSNSARGNMTLSRRFKNGRNISLRLNGDWSNNQSDNFNSSNVTYNPTSGMPDNFIYRYSDAPQKSEGVTAGLTWSEPIYKGLMLQLSYQFSHSNRNNDSKTYDMGNRIKQLVSIKSLLEDSLGYLPDWYKEAEDKALSRYTDDINNDQNIQITARYNTNFITSDIGVQFQPQHQRMEYRYQGADVDTSRNFFRVAPTVNFRYRFTRQHYIRFRYRGNMQKPQLTDLITITDTSDPLRTTIGNPDLKPSFTNNFSLEWNNYVTSRMQSYNANISYQFTDNSISSKTEYEKTTGHTTTMRENINGNWSANAAFTFSTPIFIDRIMLNTSTSANYNNNVAYIYQNQETLKNTVKDIGLGERLSLTYRTDWWDVSASGNVNYQNSDSELLPNNNKNTWNFNYGLSTTGQFENGFGYTTSINMSSRRGYDFADANTNELIWNAQISYRFLTGKQATISLQAYDILQTRSNISRQISATSRSYSENDNVFSYYMVHFIYRFNLFGTREARQNVREQRRMRGMSDSQIRSMGAGGFGGGMGGMGGGMPMGGGFGGGMGGGMR